GRGGGDERGIVWNGPGAREKPPGRKRARPRALAELRLGDEGAAPGALRCELHDGDRPGEGAVPPPGRVRGGAVTLRRRPPRPGHPPPLRSGRPLSHPAV